MSTIRSARGGGAPGYGATATTWPATHGTRAFHTAVNAFLPRDTYFVLFCDAEALAAGPGHHPGAHLCRPGRAPLLYLPKAPDPRLAGRAFRSGFSVQRVDAALAGPGSWSTGTKVVEGIADGWQTTDLFLQRGFGFCVVHQTRSRVGPWSTMSTACAARWASTPRGTIAGGAGHPDGGRPTAAQGCCGALLPPSAGTAGSNNAGSVGVAENVGFAQVPPMTFWINHWAAENVSDMTQDEFRAFAEMYERWFEKELPIGGYPHLVAATAWALARERGRCFQHLNRAVDVGWLRSVAQLRERWPEFFMHPQREQQEEWQALGRGWNRPREQPMASLNDDRRTRHRLCRRAHFSLAFAGYWTAPSSCKRCTRRWESSS